MTAPKRHGRATVWSVNELAWLEALLHRLVDYEQQAQYWRLCNVTAHFTDETVKAELRRTLANQVMLYGEIQHRLRVIREGLL